MKKIEYGLKKSLPPGGFLIFKGGPIAFEPPFGTEKTNRGFRHIFYRQKRI